MNNPYKIIGLSFLISIIGVLGIFELPKTFLKFDQSEWLAAMLLMTLATIAILVNILSNAQKIQQTIKIKSTI